MPGIRNDGIDARRVRIHQVVECIVAQLNANTQIKWIPLKQTFSAIEYETGITQQKILTYAKLGETRGIYLIDEENDQIKRITEGDA